MIFKIAATYTILAWIVGNIWWHVVKSPYSTGMTRQEFASALVICSGMVSAVVALIALVWGI